MTFIVQTSNLKQQTKNNTSKLVGPRDKKNQENTGPFPIQGTFDAQRDADELVVFESAQAVPLFIVYTDPAIPVADNVEEKKLNLYTPLLSTSLKSVEKETGLLLFLSIICIIHLQITHFILPKNQSMQEMIQSEKKMKV